ncbi:MAG: DUF559 domain-containing protein [Candidatus Kapabacteria bacterium]|nr:DUF559 domain-containing protein [Candidatus Kapabacteria bacterium]
MLSNLISKNNCIPYNPKLNERAKELRRNMTKAEKKIWFNLLRGLPYTFQRQKILDNYIVDFYCSKLQLVIEIDGDSHFSNDAIEYDKIRTTILEGYGLQVIRYTNREIDENFDFVCNEILGIVENVKPQTPFKKRGLRFIK